MIYEPYFEPRIEIKKRTNICPEIIFSSEYCTLTSTYYDGPTLKLADGLIITPGDSVGIIDLLENTEKLIACSNPIVACRMLMADYASFLAYISNTDAAPKIKELKAFTILTHLFSREQTAKYGFEVHEIDDIRLRIQAAEVGSIFARARNPERDPDHIFENKFSKVHIGWASRAALVKKHRA